MNQIKPNPNILLCTLGASWAVIPEAYAFLAPERLPLYQHHPQLGKLKALNADYQLQAPDEIWVCTTQGKQTQESLEQLQQWILLCPQAPILRIWQAEQTDQLASQEECGKIRELILRACLKAHQHANGAQVVLSLAGGRKTMSADLQWAGSLFGCQALLHVISADSLPDQLRSPQPELLTQALPIQLAGLIMPLIAGQTTRSDLLDISVDGAGPIHSSSYPLKLPAPNRPEKFKNTETELTRELNKREKASSRLFGNYLLEISRDECHENWRSLYRLPPRLIDQLRTTLLTDQHRDWLVRLPKADLHRHLGGCLDLAGQRRVAGTIWHSLTTVEQSRALQSCQTLLGTSDWPWRWPDQLKSRGSRNHNSAALLLHASDAQLEQNLWGITEPRIALKTQHSANFAAYERPGELTGSALLSHPAAIQPYAQAIVQQAVDEGLAYVELRGSPQKYGDGLAFIKNFHHALSEALKSLPAHNQPLFRFIIIADRRSNETALAKTINLAVAAKQQLPDFVVGLDMAGDEQQTRPEKIAHLFNPAFEYCLPITIHAGEGEQAESIWQAAYHLHADRIGHGLTLNDNANLAQRFRDRNICLELCPTSNREVVGFYDPRFPASRNYSRYPLLDLWKKGLPLTLCTDNPGISRTTLADEYLTASAMIDNQLNQWDVLAMIKQGFVHSFLSGSCKETLLKQVDAQIYQLISAQI
ncbi:MAG: CRISPR-associated ring nuclease [Methylococcales bacterium]|nr:CRISPR-associated ring nuclease [Methylococcales bacterium]